MQFATALPWWMVALVVAALVGAAAAAYVGALVPLRPRQLGALVTLRALTLCLLVACLLRPVRVMPSAPDNSAVVPILVDISRSMALTDAGGSRLDAARAVAARLESGLAGRFTPEILTFGDRLRPAEGTAPFAAVAERSDLSGALRTLRERYRDRALAGVIVISDGGDTGAQDTASTVAEGEVPIYTVGVGAPRAGVDFEVLDVSAGDAALADSAVDLTVAAVSRGAATPFDLRVLENGKPIDLRRVTPQAGDGLVRAVIPVSPSRDAPTLYTIEIPSGPQEQVLANNRRSVLVEPPGRRRRLLMVEGAPGFEHTFIRRAMLEDPGIEVDSVVRKGRDAGGDATFFVQSSSDRAAQLTSGFPDSKGSLFRYDAVILANVEPDSLSSVQLEGVADFVANRGGGLLVLGAKSFAQEGLSGTAIEEALPIALSDRGSGVLRASAVSGERFSVVVTSEGESHPVMRIAATSEETARRWRALPPLSGAATLGGPRPGAQVLALVRAEDGLRPLVAVQRFGRGRSMLFTGEASWRWRMRMPSSDRTYEMLWRQAARWLSSASPDPVRIPTLPALAPGESAAVAVDVYDEAFAAVADAQVTMRVTAPGGETRDVRTELIDARAGRYAGDVTFERPGIYKLTAEARQGGKELGATERWALIGGADMEMADPRLNEDVLRRVAHASGGRYVAAADSGALTSILTSQQAAPGVPRVQEMWHSAWLFAAAVMLLAAEWFLRRAWGMR